MKVREFRTYAAWKRAVKAIDATAEINGNKDIAWYSLERFYAEWDGEKGFIEPIKGFIEPIKASDHGF